MGFVATYLLANMIFKLSLLHGGCIPHELKLMVLFERPYNDIDQALELISAVYKLDGHRFSDN